MWFLGGAGSSRTLDIAPAANANTPTDGTATITVTVTATNGQTAIDTFVVTVTEVNDSPVPTNDTVADIAEDSGIYFDSDCHSAGQRHEQRCR